MTRTPAKEFVMNCDLSKLGGERLRRWLCNQKIAGSNPASGHLATPFRKEI